VLQPLRSINVPLCTAATVHPFISFYTHNSSGILRCLTIATSSRLLFTKKNARLCLLIWSQPLPLISTKKKKTTRGLLSTPRSLRLPMPASPNAAATTARLPRRSVLPPPLPSSPSPPMWRHGVRAPAAPPDRGASLRRDDVLRLRRSTACVTCRRSSPATAGHQQGFPSRALRWLAARVFSEAGSSKP
jgi:hypothetical protein